MLLRVIGVLIAAFLQEIIVPVVGIVQRASDSDFLSLV
jgi:hypothetical protein